MIGWDTFDQLLFQNHGQRLGQRERYKYRIGIALFKYQGIVQCASGTV